MQIKLQIKIPQILCLLPLAKVNQLKLLFTLMLFCNLCKIYLLKYFRFYRVTSENVLAETDFFGDIVVKLPKAFSTSYSTITQGLFTNVGTIPNCLLI
jgi:hypothetical protein